jgi:hypothetical protein
LRWLFAPTAHTHRWRCAGAELGYRGTGDVLKRSEFEARKRADREKHLHKVRGGGGGEG